MVLQVDLCSVKQQHGIWLLVTKIQTHPAKERDTINCNFISSGYHLNILNHGYSVAKYFSRDALVSPDIYMQQNTFYIQVFRFSQQVLLKWLVDVYTMQCNVSEEFASSLFKAN